MRKSFGAVDVLKGIGLEIPDGAFVSFLGPSGCGKSTLLRGIAGLEDLTEGEITLGGREITDLPSARRCIAEIGCFPPHKGEGRRFFRDRSGRPL